MSGFKYVNDAVIVYWPPHTSSDFFKLSKRVFGSEQASSF